MSLTESELISAADRIGKLLAWVLKAREGELRLSLSLTLALVLESGFGEE